MRAVALALRGGARYHRADLAGGKVNDRVGGRESAVRAIKPPFTKRRLCGLQADVLDPILFNSLLVLTTSEIATGVNHSGHPDRHATPLGRREE